MVVTLDIKKAIKTLEGGKFQNLCNKLLFEMGYENMNQLGSQNTSDRTTPGTPDTYFIKDGYYFLVEYTIQEKGLYNKIKKDIEKCIEEIKKCQLRESTIMYFYTSSNLKLEQHKKLNDLCNNYSIKLKLFNIDIIANLLAEKYPLIAKDFLDVYVDTLQVLSPTEYMEQYNNASSTVKVNQQLLFRDVEKQKILESLNSHNLILTYGSSGCGKTHLILDLMINKPKEIENYEIICIKNRSQDLFYDLKKYLKSGKMYIVFIDDINNINNLDQVLYFLDSIDDLKVKILATVRDYAKEKVLDKIRNYEEKSKCTFNLDCIKIDKLNNEQLSEILKNQTGILNQRIIRNIIYVSQGNARIMMMAASVIKGEDKEYTVEEIYDIYYKNIINKLTKESNSVIKTLSIISLLNAIDMNNNYHKSLIDMFNVSRENFQRDMFILHDNEIIDLIDDETAKISEQCISNYSIYLNIVKNKVVKLSDIINLLFNNNKARLIEDINILLNVFYSEELLEFVKAEVAFIWKYFDKYNFNKYDFLDAFGSFLENETISYCIDLINNEISQNIELGYYDIITEKNKQYSDNKILKLLEKFKHSDKLSLALDCVIKYLKKDNSIIPDTFKFFAYSFGFSEEIYSHDFHIQQMVIEKLILIDDCDNITFLLFNLIKQYLKLNGDFSTSTGKRSIVINHYSLIENENLRKFRNIMFDYLISKSKNKDLRLFIIDVMDNLYSSGYGTKEQITEVMKTDIEKLNQILINLLPLDFKLSIVIDRINKELSAFDINNKIDVNLTDKTFLFYKELCLNIDKNYKNDKTIDNMKLMVENVSKDNIDFILKDINLINSEKLLDGEYKVNNGVSSYMIALFENSSINTSELLEKVGRYDYYNIFPIERVIRYCIEKIGYANTKKIVLNFNCYNNFFFKFTCLSLVPIEEASVDELNDFIEFISQKENIVKGYSLDLSFLKKYINIDKNVFPKILNIIYETYNENSFEFSLITSLLFNEYSENTPEKLIEYFITDYNILLKSYIKLLEYRDYIDSSGLYFLMFIKLNYEDLINEYLFVLKSDNRILHDKHNLLKYIWKTENYNEIIEYILQNVLQMDSYHKIHILELLFSNEKDYFKAEETCLLYLIEKYIHHEDVIIDLFSVISKRSKEGRISCICKFLELNNNFDFFKKLDLESHSWSWSGSMVPLLEKRIDFFTELLSIVENYGIDFIEHQTYLNNVISGLEEYKKSVIRSEFFDDWL